jgi:hypothetical protein
MLFSFVYLVFVSLLKLLVDDGRRLAHVKDIEQVVMSRQPRWAAAPLPKSSLIAPNPAVSARRRRGRSSA